MERPLILWEWTSQLASNVNIGGDGSLFIGEDKVLRLEVIDLANAPVDMVGWTLLFDVRKKDSSLPPALLSKTPVVTGTFNASRALNTQRAVVTLTDTDMNVFKAATYRYSLKRMDEGNETVLAWGNFSPQKATAP